MKLSNHAMGSHYPIRMTPQAARQNDLARLHGASIKHNRGGPPLSPRTMNTFAPANDQQSSPLAQVASALVQMIKMMITSIPAVKRALDISTGSPIDNPVPGAPLSSFLTGRTVQSDVALPNNSTDPKDKQELDEIQNLASTDPEAAKLMKIAKEKGYTVEIGDASVEGDKDQTAGHNCPSDQAARDQEGTVNGVTVFGQKRIIIDRNAPDKLKTFLHELGHAATDGDGNSQDEEGIVDAKAFQIKQRLTGIQSGNLKDIYQNKKKVYQSLNTTNGIRNSFAELGISISDIV